MIMNVTWAVPSLTREGSEHMHAVRLHPPAHMKVLCSTAKEEAHVIVKARTKTVNHLCPTVTLYDFSLCVFKDFIFTLEHFVSYVYNLSENTLRKRDFIRKRMIFLSKRKMWWGFFFPP